MTRTMYDSVTAAAIPTSAAVVAGYCDQIRLPPWSAADWARFPNAIKVRIAKKPTTNDGHVLDVETGDATPAQAPGWVRLRRAAGGDPTIYCNASALAGVQAAFTAAGVPQPHYWIAQWDGNATLPAGVVAKQYQSNAQYDLSVVADVWPGVDDQQEDDLTPQQAQQLAELHSIFTDPKSLRSHIPGDQNTTCLRDGILDGLSWIHAIQQQITGEQATLLAAIQAVTAGTATPQQVTDVADSLKATLPADVAQSVGQQLAS
jgi:hypothetical protein